MTIRDRIRDFRRVRAAALTPHPDNWRTHPPRQRAVLQGLLAEIGFAGALLVRELPDGSLQILDGHLRAETAADAVIPVLVTDLTDAEAAKLLATLDPLAAMAGTDGGALETLLRRVDTESAAVAGLLADLATTAGATSGPTTPARIELPPERYQILIECESEWDQATWLARLTAEGLKCRSLIT
jgi:hypothetical protein